MTEYWKSNARKYCDFCKCWLADNKISISYHESGKRHKENVQNHISQVTKKSAKEYKQQQKVDEEMKKMEEAAMAAYLKDVKNNADLTSQNLNRMLDEANSTKASSSSKCDKDEKAVPVASPLPQWMEVRADDENVYFWNKETNETTWEPPEKYISLLEQAEEEIKLKEDEEKQKRVEEKVRKQKQLEAKQEYKAFMNREKMKEKKVKPIQAVIEASIAPVCGPAPRADPYGSWAPVPQVIKEKIDLQLPETNKAFTEPPVVLEPEVVQFKERKVESLGEGSVDFKKRKINSNTKRNIRRKVDDD